MRGGIRLIAVRCPVAALCLAVVLASCTAIETPMATPAPTPVPTPTPAMSHGIEPPPDSGAASPPVEERIYDSDAIVRATLLSTSSSSMRFTVLEYLKGTGPSVITVVADPAGRKSGHDGREAVLFLSRGGSVVSGSTVSNEFVFTDAYVSARGRSEPGYNIDTLDPAWLPAEEVAAGSSGSTSGKVFIMDSGTATRGAQETVSLADLKAKIAWVEGGEGIEGYDRCLRRVIDHLGFYKDYETFYGTPRPVGKARDVFLASGLGAGTVVKDYAKEIYQGYDRFWLTGQDSGIFSALIVDDNTSATDGFNRRIAIVRPLLGGVYKFRSHVISYSYIPCDFTPENGTGQLDWTVTVTAPAGTLHELFFDPVTVGSAVAADAANGTLKPRAFTGAGGASASISRIAYESGQVKIGVTPDNALAGQTVDFIELDGTGSLSLSVANATVDAANDTLSWTVSSAPWADGDKLMVRIHNGTAPAPTPARNS